MADQKAAATVVIFVTREGVKEVQVHTPARYRAEGSKLFEKVRPHVDKMDRAVKGS